MATLKQIDIDNSLVIELPTGKKAELAAIIAYDNGYTDVIPSSIKETKILTLKAADILIASLTPQQSLIDKRTILTPKDVNYGKTIVTYIDYTPLKNPISPVVFGLEFAQKTLGDLTKRAIKNKALNIINKVHSDNIIATEKTLTTNLDLEFNGLTVE